MGSVWQSKRRGKKREERKGEWRGYNRDFTHFLLNVKQSEEGRTSGSQIIWKVN